MSRKPTFAPGARRVITGQATSSRIASIVTGSELKSYNDGLKPFGAQPLPNHRRIGLRDPQIEKISPDHPHAALGDRHIRSLITTGHPLVHDSIVLVNRHPRPIPVALIERDGYQRHLTPQEVTEARPGEFVEVAITYLHNSVNPHAVSYAIDAIVIYRRPD